jgi:hypothetical protein
MALGDVTTIEGDLIAVEILASATATNSPPASLTAGVSVDVLNGAFGGAIPEDLTLLVVSTAGSATMTVTLRAWGKFGTLAGLTSVGAWSPLGTGTAAAKGVINNGAAIEETSADVLRHAQPFSLTAHMQRLYIEITAIGGTSTAITVFLVGRKRYGSY